MDKNIQIKRLLEKEYLKYEKYFQKNDVLKGIKKYCKESDISVKELRKVDSFEWSDDEECIMKILGNEELQKDIQETIYAVKEVNNPQNRAILYQNLKIAFQKAIEKQKETQIPVQIIFLETDYAPSACLCGFGKGNYPLLTTPQYVKYDYTQEAFNGVGTVDFSSIWTFYQKPWAEEVLSVGIDFLFSIKRLYDWQTYIMLHEVFKIFVNDDIFKSLDKVKPLFVYANEHDCEASNIYIFE